jgi:hypothetical protein
MNRIALLAVALSVAASLCSAQIQNAVGHGAFPVKLTKTWDSSKLKAGDAVEADTSGAFKLPDGTLVPKGSKLSGHVITAKAHSKGDPQSELVIAFDKLDIANGKSLMVKGTIQAVFPPADEVDPGMPVSTVSKGGAMMTGAGTGAGASPTSSASAMPTPGYQPTDIKTGSAGTNTARTEPASNPKSSGVQGIGGLELGTEGALLSTGKSVKLGSGVRMIVHVDIFGS